MSVLEICKTAQLAGFRLASVDGETKNQMLRVMAEAVVANKALIIAENKKDSERLDGRAVIFADRLRLDEKRIDAMAEGMLQVAELSDPIGEVVDEWTTQKGLKIQKIRAPLGVIGVIYEARPNVTVDVVALCVKVGSAVILRGGKEAIYSNRILFSILKNALLANGFDSECIQFIDDTTRESTAELLLQSKYVDVIIPRGGSALKDYVLSNATMPVIASAGGNCHIYVEKTTDLSKSLDIIFNAKTTRPTVCNTCEQLLVDRDIARQFLPLLKEKLSNCELVGCEETVAILGCALANEKDYATEHLALKLSIKVVDGVDEAIARINKYNTKHSDAILSQDENIIKKFKTGVDSGCIYVNASTRFTDGFEFGFGAEIGISTQKLHARGPLGIRQLVSEKYVCVGDYLIRN